MAEKKTKKTKTKTKTTTKKKQSQKPSVVEQSVVVNVNTSSKRTRKKKNTESAGTQRGNFAGRQISNGMPNNVIVHNNIDTAELVRVLRPEPQGALAPVRVQEKPPIIEPHINNTPSFNHNHTPSTTPLSIVPENHPEKKPNIIKVPVNTQPSEIDSANTIVGAVKGHIARKKARARAEDVSNAETVKHENAKIIRQYKDIYGSNLVAASILQGALRRHPKVNKHLKKDGTIDKRYFGNNSKKK